MSKRVIASVITVAVFYTLLLFASTETSNATDAEEVKVASVTTESAVIADNTIIPLINTEPVFCFEPLFFRVEAAEMAPELTTMQRNLSTLSLVEADTNADTEDEKIVDENDSEDEQEEESKDDSEETVKSSEWEGQKLTAKLGVVQGPSGKETYYNLDMSLVVEYMRDLGNTDEYWVRDDGVKMLGDYVMVAAAIPNKNYDNCKYQRGDIIETTLGLAIVCDDCESAHEENLDWVDIAVTW